VHSDPANADSYNLYIVPSLGGTSRQVVVDVSTTVALSPDGTRMVYVRSLSGENRDQLLMAKADGREEKVVFRSDVGAHFSTPSWCTRENLISVISSQPGKADSLLILSAEGNIENTLTPLARTEESSWMPDGSGLFLIGTEKLNDWRTQIWFLPYPSGKPHRVSNDLDHYDSLSVTLDGRSLVTSRWRPETTIYTGRSPSFLNDRIDWKLVPISRNQTEGFFGVAWTASGGLLQVDGSSHLYVSSTDGPGWLRLAEETDSIRGANACGNGDIVVFQRLSEGGGMDLWRLNSASGESKQVTYGQSASNSSCTPDGQWIVYWDPLNSSINKISSKGESPVELARGNLSDPVVSPDGNLLAYARREGQGAGAKTSFVVQDLDGSRIRHQIAAPPGRLDINSGIQLSWTPDQRALTFLLTIANATHLFMQPLAGGPPVQLTHFDSEPALVAHYAWSRDGGKIALTRGRYNARDIVMFSGFR